MAAQGEIKDTSNHYVAQLGDDKKTNTNQHTDNNSNLKTSPNPSNEGFSIKRMIDTVINAIAFQGISTLMKRLHGRQVLLLQGWKV